jgi:hypothetical protein
MILEAVYTGCVYFSQMRARKAGLHEVDCDNLR